MEFLDLLGGKLTELLEVWVSCCCTYWKFFPWFLKTNKNILSNTELLQLNMTACGTIQSHRVWLWAGIGWLAAMQAEGAVGRPKASVLGGILSHTVKGGQQADCGAEAQWGRVGMRGRLLTGGSCNTIRLTHLQLKPVAGYVILQSYIGHQEPFMECFSIYQEFCKGLKLL